MNKINLYLNIYSFLFLLSFNSLFITKIKSQLIIPINRDINSFYVKIFFDKEKKKPEFVKINMALDFTFIPLSKNYSSQEEISNIKIYSENEIVEIDNLEYNTKLICTDNFYLEEEKNININNFNFYYINKKDLNKENINKNYNIYNNLFYGQLGLSPLYDDNNLNLIYILKEQNIINKMTFGIHLGKNKENNYLFFGGIDRNKNEIFKDIDHSHAIGLDKKLLKKYNKWGTRIEALVVEKKTEIIKHTKHKYFTYFSLIEDRIFVPDKVMEYIISRVFKQYIKNNVCFVTEYSDKKFINCKKNKIIEEKDNFPAIIFVIKNYGFKLTYEDLFIESLKENELIFIIQKNYYDVDTSIILLGSRFFKKYLIEFDMEKYQIIFHSETVVPTINLDTIEDDFWRDIIRDYNKETEHYDSNYGKEDEKKDKTTETNDNKDNKDNKGNKDNNDNNDNVDKDDIKKNNLTESKNKNDKNNIDNNNSNNNNNIGGNDENKKIKIELDYNILVILFWIFLIIIIFVGIFVFLHFRKKIRLEKEKKYFNQPLNDEDNNREK